MLHVARWLLIFLGLGLLHLAHAQSVRVEIDMADEAVTPDAVVGVRGDTAPLSWAHALPLTDDDADGVYTAAIDFPGGTESVSYKVVIEAPDAEVRWERGSNRLLLPGRMTADRRAFDDPQAGLPVPMLSRGELRDDLAVLREGLYALHPGLTLHNTAGDLARTFDRLDETADALGTQYGDAIPMPAVYLAVARAVAALRDGHTQVSMYNQQPLTEAALYHRPDRVPFTFRLVGDRMIVTGDATPGRVLPPGTEVLTLDGRSVPEVIGALLPFASGDGLRNDDRRFRLHLRDLLAPAERFDVIYSLVFEPEGDLSLTVRRPDGSARDLAVPRTTQGARREVLWTRDASLPRSRGDMLRFKMRDDGTAYLKVGSFATFSMERDYGAWLTDAFRQMNADGAERLVVDLRGTAGGMDAAAALLLRHLLTEPATVTLWNNSTAYRRVPDAVRPHVRSWSEGFYDLSEQVTPVGDGTFRLPSRPPVTLSPAAATFRGPTAVLIDAAASSATFYLAKQIKEAGAALLVGQETGGSLKGLNAGQMAFLTLPHSGVSVDIPLFASRPPTPGPDRGIIPDVVVVPDAEAVIAGRDPDLEAALAWLRAN